VEYVEQEETGDSGSVERDNASVEDDMTMLDHDDDGDYEDPETSKKKKKSKRKKSKKNKKKKMKKQKIDESEEEELSGSTEDDSTLKKADYNTRSKRVKTPETKVVKGPSVAEICEDFNLQDVKIDYNTEEYQNTNQKQYTQIVRPLLIRANPKV